MGPEHADELLANLVELKSADARRRFRASIHEQWDGCAYCGMSTTAPTIDHIRAKAKGGDSSRSNLCSCCLSCNRSKGTDDVWDWYHRQSFFCEQRKDRLLAWMQVRVLEAA